MYVLKLNVVMHIANSINIMYKIRKITERRHLKVSIESLINHDIKTNKRRNKINKETLNLKQKQ